MGDNQWKAIAYSSNGRYVATATENGIARIWEVANRQEVVHMLLHLSATASVLQSSLGG